MPFWRSFIGTVLLCPGMAQAVVPAVNARVVGFVVLAKDQTGTVVWSVPVPRLEGKVGVRLDWTNNWLPDAVIIRSQDALGYRWFTLLERKTGQTRWQARGSPLQYAAGQLLVAPDVPSGFPNRWKFQRFDVNTGSGKLVVLDYDRPRKGCGTVVYSNRGSVSYSFPYTANPRRLMINAADGCGEVKLAYDWTGPERQQPGVRPLPCLDDAFQSVPCARTLQT